MARWIDEDFFLFWNKSTVEFQQSQSFVTRCWQLRIRFLAFFLLTRTLKATLIYSRVILNSIWRLSYITGNVLHCESYLRKYSSPNIFLFFFSEVVITTGEPSAREDVLRQVQFRRRAYGTTTPKRIGNIFSVSKGNQTPTSSGPLTLIKSMQIMTHSANSNAKSLHDFNKDRKGTMISVPGIPAVRFHFSIFYFFLISINLLQKLRYYLPAYLCV